MTTDTDRWSRLAALFREAALGRSHDYTSQLWQSIADLIEQSGSSEPAVHWSDWFDWSGGECPVPPETLVKVTYSDGLATLGSADHRVWRTVTSFSYAADNPELWLPRPAEWVPPESALPFEWRSSNGPHDPWHIASNWAGWKIAAQCSHYRLLPREAKPEALKLPDCWCITADGVLATPHGRWAFALNDFRDYGPDTIRAAVNAWLAEMERRH